MTASTTAPRIITTTTTASTIPRPALPSSRRARAPARAVPAHRTLLTRTSAACRARRCTAVGMRAAAAAVLVLAALVVAVPAVAGGGDDDGRQARLTTHLARHTAYPTHDLVWTSHPPILWLWDPYPFYRL